MSEVTEGQAPTEPVQDAPPAESSTAEHPAPGGDARTGVDSSESSGAEAKSKKEGDGFNKRISELTRRYRESEAEKERLLSVVERLSNQPEGKADSTADDGPPKRESFEDYEAFLDARSEYTVRQQLQEQTKALEAKQAEQQQQQRQAELQDKWSEQIRKGRESHDDFDAIARNDALKVTTVMAEALMESPEGADVLYWLGSNPDEAVRIANLSDVAQAAEIGRIEGRLSAERAQAAQRRSAAPEPVEPVNAGAAAPSNALSDKSNIDDWMKARNAQLYG